MQWMRWKPGFAVTLVDQSPPKLGGVPSRSEGGAVCSKIARSAHLIDGREALLINRCASRISERTLRDFEQTDPASLREGIPALLRRGLADTNRGIHSCFGQLWSMTALTMNVSRNIQRRTYE